MHRVMGRMATRRFSVALASTVQTMMDIRCADTVKRFGPPPSSLVEAIRSGGPAGIDLMVWVHLAGERGEALVALDGSKPTSNPHVAIEAWRHLNEAYDRLVVARDC